MPNTSQVGHLSEAKALVSLMEAGYVVSKPFGDGHKYDLIVDDGQLLQRVQVKTGKLINGCVVFNAFSIAGNSGGKSHGYRGRADIFAIYCPDNSKVYLVPVHSVGENKVFLRVEPTLGNQIRGINWAEEFELNPLALVR
jgi:PD-(D/E)XK endonuclease